MIKCKPHQLIEVNCCGGGSVVINGYVNSKAEPQDDHPYVIYDGKLHFDVEANKDLKCADTFSSESKLWNVSSVLASNDFCVGIADVWAVEIPSCEIRLVDVFTKKHEPGCQARDVPRLLFGKLLSAVWSHSSSKTVEAGVHFTQRILRFYVCQTVAKQVERADLHVTFDGKTYKINETVDLDRQRAMPYWLGELSSWQPKASDACDCLTVR